MSSGRALLAQANCQAGTGWHKTGSKSNSRLTGGGSSSARSTCRPTRAVACSAAKHVASPQQQHDEQQQQQSQALSVVLLLNENVRRQTNRSLLPREQLLQAVALLDAADYACMVLGTSSSSSAGGPYPLLYANQAAQQVLAQQQQPQPQQQSQQQSQQQQQQQQVQGLPSAVGGMLQQLQPHYLHHDPQQNIYKQHQQQQQACRVLENVVWQPEQQQLCVPSLLCMPMVSPNDAPFGLALLFDRWSWGDGALGVPGWPHVAPSEVPTEATLQAAADAVRAQADAVRALKMQQGLGNKDPAVLASVCQLQALKQQLSQLEGLQAAFAEGRASTLQDLLDAVQQQQQQGQ